MFVRKTSKPIKYDYMNSLQMIRELYYIYFLDKY